MALARFATSADAAVKLKIITRRREDACDRSSPLEVDASARASVLAGRRVDAAPCDGDTADAIH